MTWTVGGFVLKTLGERQGIQLYCSQPAVALDQGRLRFSEIIPYTDDGCADWESGASNGALHTQLTECSYTWCNLHTVTTVLTVLPLLPSIFYFLLCFCI